MSQSPEEIRADIERTRANLGSDVDALAEKVSPTAIAQRKTQKVRDKIGQVKDSVMGSVEDTADAVKSGVHQAGDTATGTVHSAGETVQNVPHQLAGKARGNPLAAGLIAFGAGMLISSLIPPSAKEQQLAVTLKEKAEPLTAEITDAAKQVAQDLKEPAQDALTSVKDSAAESVQRVKDEGAAAASDVKDRAQEAKATIQDDQTGTGNSRIKSGTDVPGTTPPTGI